MASPSTLFTPPTDPLPLGAVRRAIAAAAALLVVACGTAGWSAADAFAPAHTVPPAAPYDAAAAPAVLPIPSYT